MKRKSKYYSFIAVLIFNALIFSNSLNAAVVIDHTSVQNFSSIPGTWISEVQSELVVVYGHTSHGSQIVTGMGMLSSEDSLYSYPSEFFCEYCASSTASDLGNPNLAAWAADTRDYLDSHYSSSTRKIVIMWSWCGQLHWVDSSLLSEYYLEPMNQLEEDFPNVDFVYMTGHLASYPEYRENVSARNEQIRDYVTANNKILFDFADIESYDPDGTYYPDGSDACEWCETWCETHTCPSCGECAHSHCFNCYNKGKAFWYMMAVLAGWGGESSDADGDGIYDGQDNCPNISNSDQIDTDSDGYGDACDECPEDSDKTEPGVCGCGVADTDTDEDGTPDCNDGCPNDPDKTDPGECGCGVADTDTDEDGTPDCNDNCPEDPDKIDPGACGCGVADTDTDRDGTADCNDGCPDDPDKIEPGVCGCGVPDTDSDGDGIPDCEEVHRPSKPAFTSETDFTDVALRYHSFYVDGFTDPDEDSLFASEWQISKDSNFTDTEIILQKTLEMETGIIDEESKILLLTMIEPIFLADTDYWIRVMLVDDTGLPSLWSDTVAFTTVAENPYDLDCNGVDDAYQIEGNTDTNNNGVNDSEEGIVALSDAEQGKTIGLISDKGILGGITALSISDIYEMESTDISMPYGLFSFRIDDVPLGDTVNITLYFPDTIPSDAKWYTVNSPDGVLLDYTSNIVINGKQVVLTITDGDSGDADGTVNGTIIDPGGPVFTQSSDSDTDTDTDADTDTDNGNNNSDNEESSDSGCFIDAAAFGLTMVP